MPPVLTKSATKITDPHGTLLKKAYCGRRVSFTPENGKRKKKNRRKREHRTTKHATTKTDATLKTEKGILEVKGPWVPSPTVCLFQFLG